MQPMMIYATIATPRPSDVTKKRGQRKKYEKISHSVIGKPPEYARIVASARIVSQETRFGPRPAQSETQRVFRQWNTDADDAGSG